MIDNEALKIYHSLLLKWQDKINLISPTTVQNAWERHFEDSIQLADLLPDNAKTLFDLGSGAGFPGLVLAIQNPDIEVHLVESDQKKCSFLKAVSRETKTPTHVHTARIESVNIDVVPDVITARALASLDKLFGYCLSWIEKNPNLILILPKGENVSDEIQVAEQSWLFDYKTYASKTDNLATILICKNIRHK